MIIAAMTEPNPAPVSDVQVQTLCRQAAAGDEDALERLLCLHHRRMLGFARRKIDVQWRQRIEPEDVLQEAYVEAFSSIGGFQYQGEESFYHWMTRIIENRFFNHVRLWKTQKRAAAREARPGDRSSSGYGSLLDQCLREVRTPSLALRRADAEGALLGCLARLPEDYRRVIRRRFLEEADFAALAGEFGRSEDAVRRMTDRAVEKLGECLGRASQFIS